MLALIYNMVDHAIDDELFSGGYLRGHLTLALADLEVEGEHSADAVHSR
ncbi:YfcL family protein, partial [Klebsiella pneumoniae]